jgi:P4 family phage/plasmid primase-like protien
MIAPQAPPADKVEPPYSPEAEMSVLGGMLIDPDAIVRAIEVVDETMFYREDHRRLFRAMVRVWESIGTVEPVSLSEQLKTAGDFDTVGGNGYLNTLWDYVPTAANIEYHARIVREKAELRRELEETRERSCESSSALTDLGNAERLIAWHGFDLRYVSAWDRWLVWDGRRWRTDDTGEVQRRAKRTVRAMYAMAAESASDQERRGIAAWAMRSEAEARIRAMVSLARTESGVQVLPSDLDINPWLFNVENGTVDLRTGELRPHRRRDLITKLTPVRFGRDTECPTWLSFLDQILGGDRDLVTFLQRVVGYSLTGSTAEQILLLLYGTGANGKSTFLNVLKEVLGEYAAQIDFASLLVQRQDSVRNDLARLAGARMVTGIEAEEGRRFSEVVVKQLTGGDPITARFLFREHFEFTPQFTLWLAANHKPTVRGTDYAIWRRMRLIPLKSRSRGHTRTGRSQSGCVRNFRGFSPGPWKAVSPGSVMGCPPRGPFRSPPRSTGRKWTFLPDFSTNAARSAASTIRGRPSGRVTCIAPTRHGASGPARSRKAIRRSHFG